VPHLCAFFLAQGWDTTNLNPLALFRNTLAHLFSREWVVGTNPYNRHVVATMTVDEAKELIRLHARDSFATHNHHGIGLGETLVQPQKILVIDRTMKDGQLRDRELNVWLIGQEPSGDGYMIIMREDGSDFGLASPGFPRDPHPILTGWYGNLMSAFLGM
jgi:hypothetical protein